MTHKQRLWAAFWDSWTFETKGDFAVGLRTIYSPLRVGTFAHGQRALPEMQGTPFDYRKEHGLA